MNELPLLPENLQRKSLSSNEIVLPYADAWQTLAILEEAHWAVLGWEPWLKYPDASHLHPVLGDSLNREDGEDWMTYVKRSACHYREVLKDAQSHWDRGTFPDYDPSLVLYFCLTAATKDDWNELCRRRQ